MKHITLLIFFLIQISLAADEPNVYFYIKDHLGSTRMIIDREKTAQKLDDIANNRTQNYDQKGIEEVSSYYPFGKQMPGKGANNVGKVTTEKFTGKELDDEGQIDWDGDGADDPGEQGLDLSYFGARYYDTEIGSWVSMDPAEQFDSPYLYVGNTLNPISGYDSDGNYFIRKHKVWNYNYQKECFESKIVYRIHTRSVGKAFAQAMPFGIGTIAKILNRENMTNDILTTALGLIIGNSAGKEIADAVKTAVGVGVEGGQQYKSLEERIDVPEFIDKVTEPMHMKDYESAEAADRGAQHAAARAGVEAVNFEKKEAE